MKSEVRNQSSELKIKIRERTFDFAIEIVKLSRAFKKESASLVISNQLLRSGTSVGANVKESQSAQSKKDFIHKLEIALKEARETEYWLLISKEAALVGINLVDPLLVEVDEIIKILVTIIKKLKGDNSDL